MPGTNRSPFILLIENNGIYFCSECLRCIERTADVKMCDGNGNEQVAIESYTAVDNL